MFRILCMAFALCVAGATTFVIQESVAQTVERLDRI